MDEKKPMGGAGALIMFDKKAKSMDEGFRDDEGYEKPKKKEISEETLKMVFDRAADFDEISDMTLEQVSQALSADPQLAIRVLSKVMGEEEEEEEEADEPKAGEFGL